MPLRFLLDISPKQNQDIVVDGERAHYLVKVMRIKAGQSVSCFNGRGTAFSCSVAEVTRRSCRLTITSIEPAATKARYRLDMGIALLKGQAMDRAIQQSTELGATHITLIAANRGNVVLDDKRLANKMVHWEKIIEGACEQCGRLFLPQLQAPTALAQVLAQTTSVVTLFEPGAAAELTGDTAQETDDQLLLVGPEGGWDQQELALCAEKGVRTVSLGPLVLRAETMPAVALATVQQTHGWVFEPA